MRGERIIEKGGKTKTGQRADTEQVGPRRFLAFSRFWTGT